MDTETWQIKTKTSTQLGS